MAMRSEEGSRVSIPMRVVLSAVGVTAALAIAGVVVTLSPRPANALPAYAAQTKLPCGKCHVNPAGGGPRNDFGKAFAANGHQLPK
ncbi:MAG: hypothetical protein ACLPSW_33335 [Roseiarcus sp.]